jgi:hypothetical protein
VVTQDGRVIVVSSYCFNGIYAERLTGSSFLRAAALLPFCLFVMQGELKGFDQTTNVILSGSTERVFSIDEPVEEVPLGLYMIRGDNMCVFPCLFPVRAVRTTE